MCTRVLAVIILLASFSATAVVAQQWSAEQQEVIDLNQSCWEAWAAEDLVEMRRICNEHPEGTNWYTEYGAPTVGWFENNGERWFEAFMPRTKRVYFEVIPLAVSVFDNTAQIYFWVTSTNEDNEGKLTTTTRKQLNIWQKMEGRWTWIGGMTVIEDRCDQ